MHKQNISPMIIHLLLMVPLFLAVIPSWSCNEESSVSKTNDPIVVPRETRSIDLNGDGVTDIEFVYQVIKTTDEPTSTMSCMLNVRSNDSSQIQFTYPGGAVPMKDSVLIDESVGWTEYTETLAHINLLTPSGRDARWSGPWIGVGERSLGLRLWNKGSFNYAWLKFSIDSFTGIISFSDSAVQSIANKPILAGIHP